MKKLLTILLLPVLSACEIDSRASQTESDFVSYADIICRDAKFQKEQYKRYFSGLPEEKRVPIENRLTEAAQQCEALEVIKNSSLETYEELKAGMYFPKKAYLFELSYLLNGEKHSRMVGFFNSSEECEVGRTNLEKIGYEVAPCYSRVLFWKAAWA